MLIITDRHTKADLELYKEYKEIDKITAFSAAKVERSLRVIETWIANHPDTSAYTSWGKDSVVLLHLLYLMGAKIPVVYVRYKGSDNPDCELVRDAFLNNYNINYYEENLTFNKDEKKNRHHKKILIDKYSKFRITGIRNDESGIRKMIFLMHRECSTYSCRPLSLWKNKEIFAYIEQNNLPLSPVYGYLGGGRWDRKHLRTHSFTGVRGDSFGKTEWEKEYYPDILNRIALK